MNPYLSGCDVLGGDVVGDDAGMDIVQANKLVRGVRPLSAAQAHRFLQLATSALEDADHNDTKASEHPHMVAQRADLERQLKNIDDSLTRSGVDPVPDTGPSGPAEILRNAVLEAVAQYDAVAEQEATMAEARLQFYRDLADNALKGVNTLSRAAANAADDAKFYTKATFWAVLGSVVGGVALLSYGGYKLLSSESGQKMLGGLVRV